MLYKPDRTENNKNCQTTKTEWWTQDREPRARKVMSGHQQPLERQSQQSQMVLEGDKAFSPITRVSPRTVLPLRLYMGEWMASFGHIQIGHWQKTLIKMDLEEQLCCESFANFCKSFPQDGVESHKEWSAQGSGAWGLQRSCPARAAFFLCFVDLRMKGEMWDACVTRISVSSCSRRMCDLCHTFPHYR